MIRRFLCIVMVTLLAKSSALARPAVLGVVVEANRAHLNAGSVSDGATVYDGDHFSTETEGVLVLRADGAILELGAESELLLRRLANGAQGTESELSQGVLIFHTERTLALEVVALGVRIRSTGDLQTTGQVRVIGPKELFLNARRGSLRFSYHGETETVGEGEAYRVILDGLDDDPQKKGPVKAGRQKRTFVLIAISSGAAGAAVGVYESHRHKKVESPDRP